MQSLPFCACCYRKCVTCLSCVLLQALSFAVTGIRGNTIAVTSAVTTSKWAEAKEDAEAEDEGSTPSATVDGKVVVCAVPSIDMTCAQCVENVAIVHPFLTQVYSPPPALGAPLLTQDEDAGDTGRDPEMPSSSGSLPYGSDPYRYRPQDPPPQPLPQGPPPSETPGEEQPGADDETPM